VDVVMLVMNERGLQHLLSSKFELSGDAAASAGPLGRQATAGTDWTANAEILTYSRSHGLFAGITLNGAVVEPDVDSTRAIYGGDPSFRSILSGKVRAPQSTAVFMRAIRTMGQTGTLAAVHHERP
jgi:lipid-binding SYLF domain-containing protein